MAEATRESMGFDLDGFYSVQVVKQIRITWSASENTQGYLCWVHLKQCWVLPFEAEMKIDLPLSAWMYYSRYLYLPSTRSGPEAFLLKRKRLLWSDRGSCYGAVLTSNLTCRMLGSGITGRCRLH